MKKDIMIISSLISLMIFEIFFIPEYAHIISPLIIIILTLYSFLANTTRCPRCEKSFAKKKIKSYNEINIDIGTPSYFDDYIFNDINTEYECKFCKYDWVKEEIDIKK
jgi:hypothetical protein